MSQDKIVKANVAREEWCVNIMGKPNDIKIHLGYMSRGFDQIAKGLVLNDLDLSNIFKIGLAKTRMDKSPIIFTLIVEGLKKLGVKEFRVNNTLVAEMPPNDLLHWSNKKETFFFIK